MFTKNFGKIKSTCFGQNATLDIDSRNLSMKLSLIKTTESNSRFWHFLQVIGANCFTKGKNVKVERKNKIKSDRSKNHNQKNKNQNLTSKSN